MDLGDAERHVDEGFGGGTVRYGDGIRDVNRGCGCDLAKEDPVDRSLGMGRCVKHHFGIGQFGKLNRRSHGILN